MANYTIKLDLSKLNKVATTEIQGRTGKVKCVVIPIEDNNIFVSEKTGNIYLDFTAYERQQESYGQTHFVKHKIGAEKWKALSPDERQNLPICGSLSPIETQNNTNGSYQQENVPQATTTQSSRNFGNPVPQPTNVDVDLPF